MALPLCFVSVVLQRQAEKKADEQRRRRERKRKKTGPAEVNELDNFSAMLGQLFYLYISFPHQVTDGVSPSVDVTNVTPPAKSKKGRKSKSSLVPPLPDGSMSSSKPASETSSLTGEGLSARTGEGFDGDIAVRDDISVLSLDEGMI